MQLTSASHQPFSAFSQRVNFGPLRTQIRGHDEPEKSGSMGIKLERHLCVVNPVFGLSNAAGYASLMLSI
jgi:hypothetical protein